MIWVFESKQSPKTYFLTDFLLFLWYFFLSTGPNLAFVDAYNITNLLDWYDNLKNHEIAIKARDLRTELVGLPGYEPQRNVSIERIFDDFAHMDNSLG